jgi:hypothetical protein
MSSLISFKAAAIQAAPVFLDAQRTAHKAATLIREAAARGARLIAFPEVFIPGYPYWNWITDPVTGSAWFEKLVRAAIHVPGPEIAIVCNAARETGTYVVMGVNERSPISLGVLYNTLVFIGPASWCPPGPKSSPGPGVTVPACVSTPLTWVRSALSPAARIPTRWRASPCSRRGN